MYAQWPVRSASRPGRFIRNCEAALSTTSLSANQAVHLCRTDAPKNKIGIGIIKSVMAFRQELLHGLE